MSLWSVLGSSPSALLGLGPDNEDLNLLSTEELRFVHAAERQRLGLTETVGVASGAVGVLLAGRHLFR